MVFVIISLLIIIVTANSPIVTSGNDEGSIKSRIIFSPEPIPNWQISQKYSVTIQIMKEGTPIMDKNNSDNMIATDNLIVAVKLATDAENGGSYRVDGSNIERSYDDFGVLKTVNVTDFSESTPLPTDENWHDAVTFTCFYDVPNNLPFPEKELKRISIHFDINIFSELSEVQNQTGNAVLTFTFQGDNVGYSYFDYTLFKKEATSLPTVNPSITENPTSSPTEKIDPSPIQSLITIFTDLLPVVIASIAIAVLLLIAIIVKVKK